MDVVIESLDSCTNASDKYNHIRKHLDMMQSEQ
jgi:hypothetical protein